MSVKPLESIVNKGCSGLFFPLTKLRYKSDTKLQNSKHS